MPSTPSRPLTLLIGIPGAGKSTLMRAALAPAVGFTLSTPLAHVLYQDPAGYPSGVALGKPGGTFPGTDTLSLSVLPLALEWMSAIRWPAIVAEGDRLACSRFLDGAAGMGYVVDLVLLATPEDVAAARRAERATIQSVPWVKGRVTKVSRLAEAHGARVIDGTADLSEQVAALRRSPALIAIRGAS